MHTATLGLFSNSLRGTLPSELGECVASDSVFLNDNILTGTIPSEIGRLELLVVLNLASNRFTGVIPEEVCDLVRSVGLFVIYDDNDLVGCS